MTTAELVPVSTQEILPAPPTSASFSPYPMPLAEVWKIAQHVAKGGMYCKGLSVDAIFTLMLSGLERGLAPIQALCSIHMVQGKPVMSADLIVGLCKKSEACLYFMMVESTFERATYETHRRGDPKPTTYSYLLEDAKRAGLLNKDVWKAHPAAMLRARCAAYLARVVYQDIVMGLYEEDEGREIGKVEALPSLAPTSNVSPLHSRSKAEIDASARKTFHPEEDPVTDREEALAHDIANCKPEYFDTQKVIRAEIEEAGKGGTVASGGVVRLFKLFNRQFPHYNKQREEEIRALKAANSKSTAAKALAKEEPPKEEPVQLADNTKKFILEDLYKKANAEESVKQLRALVKTAQGNKSHNIITDEELAAFIEHCKARSESLKKAIGAAAPNLSARVAEKIKEIEEATDAAKLDEVQLALGGFDLTPDEESAVSAAYRRAEERLGM